MSLFLKENFLIQNILLKISNLCSTSLAGGNRILPQYHRKCILGIHTGEFEIEWQDLLEQKQREELRQCLIHYLVAQHLLACGRSPACGAAGLHLFPPSPGGPGPRAAEPLAGHLRLQLSSTVSVSAQLPPHQHRAPARWAAKERVSLGCLLSLDYISLGLGESRLSFKLSNIFPGFF